MGLGMDAGGGREGGEEYTDGSWFEGGEGEQRQMEGKGRREEEEYMNRRTEGEGLMCE